MAALMDRYVRVCINQADELEANVWIWLGEADSTGKIATEAIPEIIQENFHWDGLW